MKILSNKSKGHVQRAAKAVQRVSDEISHDILWGIRPTYVPGVVLRRRAGQTVRPTLPLKDSAAFANQLTDVA